MSWADLPADFLRDIYGRLHTASDVVRFHAMCRPWRTGLDHKKILLPWLVAPSGADDSMEDQRCRCVFSKTSYSAPGICVQDRRVARTDGTAAWVLSAHKDLRLVNPLTADSLPFPGERLDHKWLDHRHRIISGDGTILLYDFTQSQPEECYPPPHRFQASFRGHDEDDGEWRHVSSNLGTDRCCAAAYYHGYIMCVGLAKCHLLWPDWQLVFDDLYIVERENTTELRAVLPSEPGKVRRCSYLFESGGELLLASVLQEDSGTDLSVSLHVLRYCNRVVEWLPMRSEQSDDWASVLKLDDAVLFLGFPASFAVDGALFGGEVSGGTAYFVIDNTSEQDGRSGPPETCSVYRYSFMDGATTLVETLPPGWHDARCMWFLPNPQLSLFHTPITHGQQGDPVSSNDSTTQPQQLTIYVGDLSLKVDGSKLRDMFSKHGKVTRARVMYDNRGRSRGFRFVTMATQEGFDNAIAAHNTVK
ncbi:hypothetical protein VPH35_126004 [Triticum aestivum]